MKHWFKFIEIWWLDASRNAFEFECIKCDSSVAIEDYMITGNGESSLFPKDQRRMGLRDKRILFEACEISDKEYRMRALLK